MAIAGREGVGLGGGTLGVVADAVGRCGLERLGMGKGIALERVGLKGKQ
jgi:hypothetical protein